MIVKHYTPYLLDAIFIGAGAVFLATRYRSMRESKSGTIGFLAWSLLTLAVLPSTVYTVHRLVVPTEAIKRAEPSLELNPDEIVISKESQILFGIRTALAVQGKLMSGIRVTGYVRAIPQRRAEVVAPVSGRVKPRESLTVGSRVRRGQTLAVVEQVLSASDLAGLEATRTELKSREAELSAVAQAAEAKLSAAKLELERAQRLLEVGAAPLRRVQEAKLQVELAQTEMEAANKRLSITQSGSQSVAEVKSYALTSPISGVIARADFSAGEQVDAGKSLFTVVDLERVWIEAEVFEKDLAVVTGAQEAEFTSAALPGQRFMIAPNSSNHLLTIGTEVHPEKRTVAVIYEVANPQGRLKDGMTAEVVIKSSSKQEVVSIPKRAVSEEKGRKVVYVYTGGEQFTRRSIQLGQEGSEQIEVKSGLKAGERIVVEGLYQLRSN